MADEHSVAGVHLNAQIALWRLQEQLDRSRSLDSRLANSFGLSAAMIALLGSALLFANRPPGSGVDAAVIVGASLFIANILISAAALLIGHWELAPNLAISTRFATTLPSDEFTLTVTESVVQAIERNERGLRLKGWLVSLAIGLTAATAVAIAAAAILLTGQ